MNDITNPTVSETVAASQGAEKPATPAPEAVSPDNTQLTGAENQDNSTPELKEGQPEEGKEEGKRKGKSAGEFIGELKGKLNATREQLAQAQAELQRLKQPLRPPGPDASQDEIDRYNVKAAVRESRAEEVAQAAEVAQREVASKRFETFTAKAEAAAERMPGLVDKFLALPVVSTEIADFVAESDKGAEVAFYFTANPGEADRISRLPAYQQGIELARIEGRVTAASQVRKATAAPPPPPAMPGTPAPSGKKPEDMNPAEYSAWYRDRQKRKAG